MPDELIIKEETDVCKIEEMRPLKKNIKKSIENGETCGMYK